MSEASQEIGANSDSYRVTAKELRDFIDRFEALDEQKKDLSDEQKDLKAFMKAKGYDLKAFAEIIRRRKRNRKDVEEHLAIVQLYEEALGIFG